MTILALALWMKVAATVSLTIAGLVMTTGFALFGSGADVNTAVTSRSWIPSAIIFSTAIFLIWFLSSCTVVATDFMPKPAWYWSAEAKQYRAEHQR